MVILSDHNDSTTTSNATLERKSSYDQNYDRYDVFLSFRGSDTRFSFTDHLYHKLIDAGFPTFRDDDELVKGEPLKRQLEKAITESSVSIIIFSDDYASSRWCLDEVVRILEQKKIRPYHKVIPIFYHVDAYVVRYQKGSYGEAFQRHMEKGYVSLDKIEAWKAALTEAANLVGLTLNKSGPETEFIKKIVCEVENSLPNSRALDVPEHLVGMSYRAKGINSWFKDKSKDENVLVIWGIGGMGKTTIAKHFFNKYFRDFDGSCFLARITEMWDQNGVCSLQSQLLSNIVNKQTLIFNRDEGTEKIKRAICNKKVLLVLDDVSETEQLDSFLGQQQRFYPGSKIIVITRNVSLVKDFIVPATVHKIEGLNNNDSLELFSWHAFRQGRPLEEYMNLSQKIFLRCEGHPLALIVLGSSLRKNLDTLFWEKQLRKWNQIGNPSIQKVMQISYDSLEDDTMQNLFLHIAFFFVGAEEDYVVKILDQCGLHATVGIQNLIDRCLITKAKYGTRLMMHQVIQDMGREIVRQECPNEPGRRSRLWYHEDSFNVLKYNKGTEAVQGLILDGQKINNVESGDTNVAVADVNSLLVTRLLGYVKNKKEEVIDRSIPSKKGELRIDSFANMVNLKLLKLNNVYLTGSCNKFPKELRCISWHGFPLKYVPAELHLENMVALDLQHSILKQVWKGYMEVQSLKFLNLSYSPELCQTPDFRGLLQLERLILRGCFNMVKVCKTIGILKRLVLLDLTDCKSLRDLPGLPESLLTLELSGCSHLGKLPTEPKNIKRLDKYRIVKYASPNISTGPVKLLSNLPHLLVRLSLEYCNLSDECFPRKFSGLSSLESLDLSGNLITRLPDCVRNLSNSRLHRLIISYSPQLQSVIHPPSTVTSLELINNRQLGITKTIEKTKHLHLVVESSAKHIEHEGCFKWVKARNVERKVIKSLGLESVPIGCVGKVLYEYGIFSTFVYDTTKVPCCFKTYYISSADGEGDSAKLWHTIPSSDARRIQGLNLCMIINTHPTLIDVTVLNTTKDLAWTYRYENRFGDQGRKSEQYMWLSTWKCVDLFDADDEIEVSFRFPYDNRNENLKVKEWGIRFVYEEDLVENSTSSVYSEDDHEETSLLWSDEVDVSFFNHHTHGIHYNLLGFSSNDYFKRRDITEEMDGRAVQLVNWWGLNTNWCYEEGKRETFLMYTFKS